MQVNPYLNFDGRCAEAFQFYADLLRGKIEGMMTHGNSPLAGETPPAWRDKIMHARLVADDVVLMGSDAPPDRYERPQGFYVSLTVEKAADAERIFRGFAENGSVQMPFQKTFWAAGGFGMVVDRFGIPWMVNCEKGA